MPPVRTVRLRVIGGAIDLRSDVPKTRAECPTERWGPNLVCGHIHCRYHLWLLEGRDRPGRRSPGRAMPTATLRGDAWVARWPIAPMCALDVAERVHREELDVADVSHALGIAPSRGRELMADLRRKWPRLRDLIDE